MTLSDLKLQNEAIVEEINIKGPLRRRLSDLGLIKGTRVKCVSISPQGDPKAYLIRGAVIAIRGCDSGQISVRDYNG